MINVLIADDNVSFCETLFSVLTKEKDLKVSGIVNNEKEVKNKYFEIKPDCLILDLNMPQKTGLDIIRDLTIKEKNPKQNIIVISGDTNFRTNLTNVEKVKWIFSKPFETEKLIEVIKDTIEKKNVIEELNYITDELLSKLEIPLCKGRKLLKIAIIIAYVKPQLLEKNDVLMSIVAKKENYGNAKSVRSIIDKTIEKSFNRAKDKNIFYMLDEFYGEKLTTKVFINSSVLYIHRIMRNT